jgi:hypothetical protein
MRRTFWFLLLWLLGMLFPLAWLSRFSLAYRQVFNAIFGLEWMHVLMHLILFAGLCILMTVVFKLRPGWRTASILAGAVLLAGITQEALQIFSQGVNPAGLTTGLGRSGFDLMVDLSGGLLGLLAASLYFRERRPSRTVFPDSF